jgi:hypothetical protein
VNDARVGTTIFNLLLHATACLAKRALPAATGIAEPLSESRAQPIVEFGGLCRRFSKPTHTPAQPEGHMRRIGGWNFILYW